VNWGFVGKRFKALEWCSVSTNVWCSGIRVDLVKNEGVYFCHAISLGQCFSCYLGVRVLLLLVVSVYSVMLIDGV
jgi:hypothetical protein